jgi:mono/diheme cytochrome c family protein
VKHFEFEQASGPPRRLETRVLFVDQDGGGYGGTYRWNQDQSDAELLNDALTEEIALSSPGGPHTVTWTYPSRNDCFACHTRNAGFVLGVNTRQLNREFHYLETGAADNQLRAWRHAAMLENAPPEQVIDTLPRLAAIGDTAVPLDRRVRSYLDANCAQCHRPGGARGTFDTRFDTPLARQGLVGGKLIAADLGIPDAAVVTSGSPERSMVYLRMNRRSDAFNMPPLASHRVDEEALAALAAWIKELSAGEAR